MTATEEGRPASESAAGTPPSNPIPEAPAASDPVTESAATSELPTAGGDTAGVPASGSRRILIGSQRDPAAYRVRPKRDWTPVEGEDGPSGEQGGKPHRRRHRGGKRHGGSGREQGAGDTEHGAGSAEIAPTAEAVSSPPAFVRSAPVAAAAPPVEAAAPRRSPVPLPPVEPLPEVVVHPAEEDDVPVVPGRRQKLTAAMEAELDRAMAGVSLDDLMSGTAGWSFRKARSSPNRGIASASSPCVATRCSSSSAVASRAAFPLQSLETPPAVGDEIEVVVQRYHAEEGLYDLGLPGAAVELGNWDEVQEGMLVDAAGHRPQHGRAGVRSEPHPRLHPREPDFALPRGGPGPVRRPALHLPDHRGQPRAEEPRPQPPRRAGAREGGKEAAVLLLARAGPDPRRHRAEAAGFRRVRRAGQRDRRPAARQPVVVGPREASQRGRAGRPDHPRPHREDRPADGPHRTFLPRHAGEPLDGGRRQVSAAHARSAAR